jgi:hypothetical protein
MVDQTHRATFSTSSPNNSPSSSSHARRISQHAPQTSLPSSAFFASLPDDEHEMHAIPDAERHFGSSSSFRRHVSVSGTPMPDLDSIRTAVTERDPSGIWDRLVGLVKGIKPGGSPEQNGYELAPKVAEQTPSAKYASCTAEVRPSFVS